MNQDHNYPNRYELLQALGKFCLKRFVVNFSQKRGIFITNATLEENADFLSGIFFDHSDLEEIRIEALGGQSNTSLSGFWLNSSDEKYDFVYELEKHVNEIVDEKTEMKLGPITGNETDGYKGNIYYMQQQPGRVQFLQGMPRDFDFYIQKKDETSWEVFVEGERSNDAKLMISWLEHKIPREVDVTVINQDELTTEQTIHFFDLLASRAVTSDWVLSQVKRIVLKRELEVDKDDEETKTIEDPSLLTGISQAILEGSDLRRNSFVKQCENSSYRFTAMTYVYENKDRPFAFDVRAEFKGRPKVFEVSLEGYFQRIGLDEKLEAFQVTQSEKIRLLSRFYSEAKHLYDELTIRTIPFVHTDPA